MRLYLDLDTLKWKGRVLRQKILRQPSVHTKTGYYGHDTPTGQKNLVARTDTTQATNEPLAVGTGL